MGMGCTWLWIAEEVNLGWSGEWNGKCCTLHLIMVWFSVCVYATQRSPAVDTCTVRAHNTGRYNSSSMSEGHRKRHREQMGELFSGREKRRRIEDPVSSPVLKVVESKERGRRRKMVHGGKSGSTRWTEESDQTRPGGKVS